MPPYNRPAIQSGVTKLDKPFFDNLLDGLDERMKTADANATYAPVATADTVDLLTNATVVRKVKRVPDNITWITKFASGHGWTTGASEIAPNSAEAQILGTQGLKFGPANVAAQKTIDSPTLSPTLDMTGKLLVVAVKSLDTFGGGLNIYLANTGFTAYKLYGNPDPKHYNVDDEWTFVTIHPDAASTTVGTLDMAAIQKIRIGFDITTGTHAELVGGIGTIPIQTKYPNGVVSIDFDDNAGGQFSYARPLMVARGFPGTICAIGEGADNAPNGQFSVEYMHMLEDVFGWEIGGHARTFADHVDMRTLTDAQIEDAVLRNVEWLTANRFRSNYFAYPQGLSDPRVRNVVRRYFALGRTTGPDSVAMNYPVTSSQMNLPCHFGTTVADITAKITQAAARKQWLSLGFHNFVPGASAGGAIGLADFTTILDAIVAAGMPVVTPSTLFGLPQ